MKIAVIDKTACIGCNRCVAPCPVDAIVGTSGYLHDVHYASCIGCKLCVPYCPAECIDMVDAENLLTAEQSKQTQAKINQYNFKMHKERLTNKQQQNTKMFTQDKKITQQQLHANIQQALANAKK